LWEPTDLVQEHVQNLKKKEELNFLLNHKKSMNKFIQINKKMN